ncbi:hypothetical protein L218DRAFT_645077 [Marasmius fiardii PR-910]|nr:hypothetical protein L218DRAFT_645077 [Marasmius fiardii PR-910]
MWNVTIFLGLSSLPPATPYCGFGAQNCQGEQRRPPLSFAIRNLPGVSYFFEPHPNPSYPDEMDETRRMITHRILSILTTSSLVTHWLHFV